MSILSQRAFNFERKEKPKMLTSIFTGLAVKALRQGDIGAALFFVALAAGCANNNSR